MARKVERRRKKAPDYVRVQKAYPAPEIVDGADSDWKIVKSGNTAGLTTFQSHTMKVPLGTDSISQGVRMHEMLHVAYTPENWHQLAVDAGVDPDVVQHSEDARIEFLGHYEAGIDAGQMLTPDEAHQLAVQTYKNPRALAGMFMSAWMQPNTQTELFRAAAAIARNEDAAQWVDEHAADIAKLDPIIRDNPANLLAHAQDEMQRSRLTRLSAVHKAYNLAQSIAGPYFDSDYLDPDYYNPGDFWPHEAKGPVNPHDFEASIRMARELTDSLPEDIEEMLPAKGEGDKDGLTPKGEHTREGVEQGIDKMSPPEVTREKMEEMLSDFAGTMKPEMVKGTGMWGKLLPINEWPRPLVMPSRLRGNMPALTDEGALFTAPYRLTIDNRVFRTIRKRPGGGAVLIDRSGSMHLRPDQVLEIMTMMPAAIIASYSGSRVDGRLDILAKDGRRARDESISQNYGGNNCVDGPALLWLAEQKGPRFWVSDGHVTGVADAPSENLRAHATLLCRKHRIRRFDSIEEVMEFADKQGIVIR